ncbi:hypothetical protein V493_04145 [Pseudogymnoascus sp. VKM F-4281 (FW-2241)]|nr:hypothetical protein V493_04145 [Pseudogymnoascus sp. VKM F-4281 (FW-2241)]
MRSFVSPLGYSLIIASFIVSHIHLATAACTNTTTFVYHSIETYVVQEPENNVILDFISCPSSETVSCTLPSKNYTFTIAPQFKISTTNSSFDEPNFINAMRDDSHELDLPLNSSDRKAINEYMRGFWEPLDGRRLLAVSPVTVTVTSENITSSERLLGEPAIDLTVEPGYNMTLIFKFFRVANWVRYAQCDNKTLDESFIGAIMPYYNRGPQFTHLRIAGTYLVDKQFLNDTVPEDSSGVGLKAGSVWATTLIVFGVLAFNWL